MITNHVEVTEVVLVGWNWGKPAMRWPASLTLADNGHGDRQASLEKERPVLLEAVRNPGWEPPRSGAWWGPDYLQMSLRERLGYLARREPGYSAHGILWGRQVRSLHYVQHVRLPLPKN